MHLHILKVYSRLDWITKA